MKLIGWDVQNLAVNSVPVPVSALKAIYNLSCLDTPSSFIKASDSHVWSSKGAPIGVHFKKQYKLMPWKLWIAINWDKVY